MTSTFEDRLLTELQQEVERTVLGEGQAPSRAATRRRLVTPRRAVFTLATACAATATTVVALPGSPAPAAYAVEAHPDGSVSVSLFDLTMDTEEQARLVEEVREAGVSVEVLNQEPGMRCVEPLGEGAVVAMESFRFDDSEDGTGEELTVIWTENGPEQDHVYELAPSDTMVVEKLSLDGRRHDVFHFVEGDPDPCEPMPVDGFERPVDVHPDATPSD
ncbi:hypothetical protein ACTWP5_14280 [Streptomyces sp. 4N509B]|uniref:hypothetical protein n=1 Tax=Streptomyces sp. 4N509B TaxID=3457413 RepID=UPI003FD47AC6